jgi:hypothetical protein
VKTILTSGEHNNNSISSIKDTLIKLYPTYEEVKSLSKTSLWRMVTRKKYANGAYKIVNSHGFSNTNTRACIESRYEFLNKFIYLVNKGFEPIYVDESSFNTHFHPRRGYSIRGKRVRLKFIGQKSKNQSFIAAVTRREVLGCMFVNGSVKGSEFYGFLSRLDKEYNIFSGNYFIVLDNAKCHHNKQISKIFKKHTNLLFLPAYSPYLSIVENFFGEIKRDVKKQSYSCLEDLYNNTRMTVKAFETRKLDAFYKHSLSYFERGLCRSFIEY